MLLPVVYILQTLHTSGYGLSIGCGVPSTSCVNQVILRVVMSCSLIVFRPGSVWFSGYEIIEEDVDMARGLPLRPGGTSKPSGKLSRIKVVRNPRMDCSWVRISFDGPPYPLLSMR